MRACVIVLLVVLTACGRFGFELQVDGASPDGSLPTGNANVLDRFDTISYSNDDGTQSWATPWIEVGDDGDPNIAGNSTIFVESHPQNPTPDSPALKVRVASSGQYIYREANLTGATSATLSYRFHNELQGAVETQISPDGGGMWTTLTTYVTADMFGTETISIIAYASAHTQIRFIATAAGARHLRIDDLEIAFVRP